MELQPSIMIAIILWFYLMIIMEKNWTNKMSASSSQKQTNKQGLI